MRAARAPTLAIRTLRLPGTPGERPEHTVAHPATVTRGEILKICKWGGFQIFKIFSKFNPPQMLNFNFKTPFISSIWGGHAPPKNHKNRGGVAAPRSRLKRGPRPRLKRGPMSRLKRVPSSRLKRRHWRVC